MELGTLVKLALSGLVWKVITEVKVPDVEYVIRKATQGVWLERLACEGEFPSPENTNCQVQSGPDDWACTVG